MAELNPSRKIFSIAAIIFLKTIISEIESYNSSTSIFLRENKYGNIQILVTLTTQPKA